MDAERIEKLESNVDLGASAIFAGAVGYAVWTLMRAAFAPPVLLGKLFRLFGADATIFPNHGGRFSFSRDTCLAIAKAAREPWSHVLPALPVPAGGMFRFFAGVSAGRM